LKEYSGDTNNSEMLLNLIAAEYNSSANWKRFSTPNVWAQLMHDGTIAIVRAKILLAKRIAKSIAVPEISIMLNANRFRIEIAKPTEASTTLSTKGIEL
jgi:hypothetical protein